MAAEGLFDSKFSTW